MNFINYNHEQTRIKICGLSNSEDISAAISLGIDAIGLVFYKPSSRYISPLRASEITQQLPSRIAKVALVVNATDKEVKSINSSLDVDIWQFHGDESPERCSEIAQGKFWIKAALIDKKFKLSEFCLQYNKADAWLLDTVVEGYGGGGKTFDWDLIPKLWLKENAHRVVLSGGLNSDNVEKCIEHFHPLGVDVSSGVEKSKGIKDATLMKTFVEAVRHADSLFY